MNGHLLTRCCYKIKYRPEHINNRILPLSSDSSCDLPVSRSSCLALDSSSSREATIASAALLRATLLWIRESARETTTFTRSWSSSLGSSSSRHAYWKTNKQNCHTQKKVQVYHKQTCIETNSHPETSKLHMQNLRFWIIKIPNGFEICWALHLRENKSSLQNNNHK